MVRLYYIGGAYIIIGIIFFIRDFIQMLLCKEVPNYTWKAWVRTFFTVAFLWPVIWWQLQPKKSTTTFEE